MALKAKFSSAVGYSVLWLLFSLVFAIPWISEISSFFPYWLAWVSIAGSALLPGVAMSFVNSSILLDRRPRRERLFSYPDVTVLVAAYNEEKTIFETLRSISSLLYPGNIRVIVCSDGSTDRTSEEVLRFSESSDMDISLIEMERNSGKANALNRALQDVDTEYVVTLDADSTLHPEAMTRIVETIEERGSSYSAVAGSILCENSRDSYMARMQYWDYALGISAVKRAQSMYEGTLVAQGAFSIYRSEVLVSLGGWPDKIGEDIVLSWSMLDSGYLIGHSEKAVCWTRVPVGYRDFYKQRRRWSRGLIEAFRSHPSLLTNGKMYSIFVWYNLMFPYIDLSFMLVFVPGVFAAFFGFYLLAGKITLMLLPVAFLYGLIMVRTQRKSLEEIGIFLEGDSVGYLMYMLLYQFVMSPSTISGYFSEIFKRKRVWK